MPLPSRGVNESDFHEYLRRRSRASRAVPLPIGDDLAAVSTGDVVLLGADQVLEGVHFDLSDTSPGLVGRKAVNRNFSDVAAMAGWPTAVVVTYALPRDRGGLLMPLHAGVEAAAAAFGCPVVGGDTGVWDGPLAVSVSVLGTPGPRVVTRRGAREGDGLYVTGRLGGSLHSGRHLAFTPRLVEARRITRRFEVHAMIDLSDGLSRDLPRLVSGAVIDSDAIPRHDGCTLAQALHDGEDYELLFATPACDDPAATRIGAVTGDAILLDDEPLEPLGYEHRTA